MAQLRPTGFAAPPSPFEASLSLTDDLGVDSLELVTLASALNEMLHLHASGVEDRLLTQRRIGDWVGIAREGLAEHASTMTFRTSGSMGSPKRCDHQAADLYDEVAALSSLFAGRRRVLTAVRSHHIYGFLFTVVLPDVLHMSPDAVLDVRDTLPSSLPARMREGDLVIGYPDFWRDLARAPVGIPPDVIGVTSTAPCPDAVARDLEALGLAQLVQVYGSTETGGVGVRVRADAPFALLAHWQHRTSNARDLARTSRDGRVTTVVAPDMLEWSDDRHFRPMRRADDVVQVGGLNVSLAAVRQALLEHPEVRDASVRALPTQWGDRIKAFIVPANPAADHRSLHVALEEWITHRLPATHRPRALSFGTAIPKSALGKPIDWDITTLE